MSDSIPLFGTMPPGWLGVKHRLAGDQLKSTMVRQCRVIVAVIAAGDRRGGRVGDRRFVAVDGASG